MSAEHFPWSEGEAARRAIDRQVHRAAMEQAQQHFLHDASPCPGCGAEPKRLFWMFISSPEAAWVAGDGRAGFLTLCDHCKRQVDFFRDPELEEIERDLAVPPKKKKRTKRG